MIELVGEGGYEAVTLRRLTALAGVSTRTFYEHFEGKEQCFLETYELVVKRIEARVISAQTGESDWSRRVELALQGFAAELINKPRAARLALREIFAAGPAAHGAMARAEAHFEEVLTESFVSSPRQVEISPLLAKAIVSGVAFVARTRMVDAGPTAAVTADELCSWVLLLREMSAKGSLANLTARTRSNLSLPRAEPGEREAILAATAKLAAASGYWELTKPRILAAAGLRKNNFTAHFSGVEDCFLAALEQRTAGLASQVMKDSSEELSWPKRVRQIIENLCAVIADDPVTAKLVFVEARSAGQAAVSLQDGFLASLANDLVREAPGSQGRPASPMHAEASLAALWGIARSYVDSGREGRLFDIAAVLTFLFLAPVNGLPPAPSTSRVTKQASNVIPQCPKVDHFRS